ncbi:MAG: isochorismatase family cysteine hydrolase [Eggerthellaceae bacterium]|nr:isochorismatase family cysteine hydrolase [Eggerthellaceae bacterium]
MKHLMKGNVCWGTAQEGEGAGSAVESALPCYREIAGEYRRWLAYLEDNVDFSLPGSVLHGPAHTRRVLLYALSLAFQRGLDAADTDLLATCAVFHDTRRWDDWMDTGHGARAAEHYAACQRSAGATPDELAQDIMAFHDVDDAKDAPVIARKHGQRGLELYRMFKDADALDRFRLGEDALDERFLRTVEAKNLIDAARSISLANAAPRLVGQSGNILVVVDAQNDFISGALGSDAAQAVLPRIVEKVKTHDGLVVFTKDTHGPDYLDTQEGRRLPVPHCVGGTFGWEIPVELASAKGEQSCFTLCKPTFGSMDLPKLVSFVAAKRPLESIELVGYCTDICVVSNALILKAAFPEVRIAVDGACCAGTSEEAHASALLTMQSCQIEIV